MANLLDFIYSIEKFYDTFSGSGICVSPLFEANATGTCGCVGICEAPIATLLGTADWAPIGICVAPLPEVMGTCDDYRPAWGEMTAPLAEVSGAGHQLITSECIAPPAFCAGYTGAIASNAAPSSTVYALSGYNTSGAGACVAPLATVEGYSCGLDTPIANSASSASVVALLQEGNITIADAAAQLFAGLTTSDQIAAKALQYVAGFTYVSDSTDSGIGDRWTCALATLLRQYGDCEDGAILLQSLLLAAGVAPGRVITCFGTASDNGHAWTIYRRESDEEWVALEWTDSSSRSVASVDNLTRMVDLTATYTEVNYILTSTAFSSITTATWLLRITTLTADGACTAPLPTVTGQTNLVGKASLTAPMPTMIAYAGARAALTAPKATASAAAHTELTAAGTCTAPLPTVAGYTGARGDCTAPSPTVTILAGAKGVCTAPLAKVAATATSQALVAAALTAPMPIVSGYALVGALVTGDCVAPLPVVHATDLPSLTAKGVVRAPVPQVSATAAILLEASVDLVAPLPVVSAQGHSVPAWATSLLQYDPMGLA